MQMVVKIQVEMNDKLYYVWNSVKEVIIFIICESRIIVVDQGLDNRWNKLD